MERNLRKCHEVSSCTPSPHCLWFSKLRWRPHQNKVPAWPSEVQAAILFHFKAHHQPLLAQDTGLQKSSFFTVPDLCLFWVNFSSFFKLDSCNSNKTSKVLPVEHLANTVHQAKTFWRLMICVSWVCEYLLFAHITFFFKVVAFDGYSSIFQLFISKNEENVGRQRVKLMLCNVTELVLGELRN